MSKCQAVFTLASFEILCGVERTRRFVKAHLHCIVRNLKKHKRNVDVAPLEKFLQTSICAHLPFSYDVAECVISRDEHEYYGDTMRHWFLLKIRGPSNNCASGPLKASSGTEDMAVNKFRKPSIFQGGKCAINFLVH